MGLITVLFKAVKRFFMACRHDYELIREKGNPVGYQCRKCDNRLPYVRPEDLLE